MSGVSSEYKDLAKFAENTDPHFIGEELEDSLKKSKGKHYSLQDRPSFHWGGIRRLLKKV